MLDKEKKIFYDLLIHVMKQNPKIDHNFKGNGEWFQTLQ
jgi:hypothetical protein